MNGEVHFTQVKVLDHGFVQLVESWGSDERIIEAARMSTNKGATFWGPKECPEYRGEGRIHSHNDFCNTCKGKKHVYGDEKLLRYLWEHKHSTPFEMAGMTIEVQCPIFVLREWHRHRTQSYSELSARYTPLPDVNYMPTVERILMTGKSKQAQGTGYQMTESNAVEVRIALQKHYKSAERLYQLYLNMGVPKELARLVIPVGRYSKMRASANLRNWLAFLTLRMDEAAQYEIRMYANEVAKLIADLFPRTYELFAEGRR